MKNILLLFILTLFPAISLAQYDDVYFVPKHKEVVVITEEPEEEDSIQRHLFKFDYKEYLILSRPSQDWCSYLYRNTWYNPYYPKPWDHFHMYTDHSYMFRPSWTWVGYGYTHFWDPFYWNHLDHHWDITYHNMWWYDWNWRHQHWNHWDNPYKFGLRPKYLDLGNTSHQKTNNHGRKHRVVNNGREVNHRRTTEQNHQTRPVRTEPRTSSPSTGRHQTEVGHQHSDNRSQQPTTGGYRSGHSNPVRTFGSGPTSVGSGPVRNQRTSQPAMGRTPAPSPRPSVSTTRSGGNGTRSFSGRGR